MLKVFISSTTKDLQEFRDFTNRFIRGLDLIPVAMEDWPTDGRKAIDAVSRRLGNSDLYIGILAWRYGETIPVVELDEPITRRDVANLSYTEFEYCLAEKRGLRRLLFMTKPDGSWTVPEIDVNREEIQKFRETVRGAGVVCFFKDLPEFCLQFSKSFVNALRESEGYQGLPAADKALLEVANLISQDLTARQSEMTGREPDEPHNWFVREIGRCNLGERYIGRRAAERTFADWVLHHPTPFFLLVGASGLGKTNFMVDQIRYFVERKADPEADQPGTVRRADRRFQPVVFFPLGIFNPRASLAENIRDYIKERAPSSLPAVALEALAEEKEFEALIKSGNILLILDGLDELARQKGEGACGRLLEYLARIVGDASYVVVTCRDHIYHRLRRAGLFDDRFETVELAPLDNSELDRALDERGIDCSHVAYDILFDREAALRALARHPFLLELLLQIPYSCWRRLSRNPHPARLYDLWFEETARLVGAGHKLDFAELAHRVARLMLEERSDILDTATLQRAGLSAEDLRGASEDRLSVFVQQTTDEWGFVHDSFREYSLAKTIDQELRSRQYELLAEVPSLDYVGSETVRFLSELMPSPTELMEVIRSALGWDSRNRRGQWNNLVQNCCEVVGMMAVGDVRPYVEQCLRLLNEGGELTNQTKYNLVRCLERLHDSAVRPYWQHVMQVPCTAPNERYFGVATVRGFHRGKPGLGYSAHIEFLRPDNESAPEQLPVSDVLVSMLERYAGGAEPNGGLVEVNCSLALIRWLHNDHVARLWELGDRVCSETRGNLFHACRRLHDCGQLLADHCGFFRGMYLYFIQRRQALGLPENCLFEDVTFFESRSWQLRFESPAFPNPRTERLSNYKPSYSYVAEK